MTGGTRPRGAAPDERLRIGIVVQRYGADINGGAELHARYIAEHLAPYADIRVLTTCATSYVTWRNDLPPGEERINGIPVERFPVVRERNPDLLEFGRHSTKVFMQPHSLDDELRWLEVQGPVSPELIQRIARAGHEFDFVLGFSLRYHPTYQLARTLPRLAVLVPTAERESAIGLSMFAPVLRGVRALMYNSLEERAMLQTLSENHHVPGVVVGIGSDIPADAQGDRARTTFGLHRRFALYVGRIDVNKGCREMFEHFLEWQRVRYLTLREEEIDLVLIGTAVMDIPAHPRIRHLGFVSDRDKYDVLAAASLLLMPSYYESLSMVALEAWALGKPVVANARCDVLLGQCQRSDAGLYYRDAVEFGGALDAVLDSPVLAAQMGARGREYFRQHYSWPVIERKYLDMFQQLRAAGPGYDMEPLPGFLERRRKNRPPAHAVVEALPSGPAPDDEDEDGTERTSEVVR